MSRIWLTANGGHGTLDSLLARGDVRLDRVKVGSWMGDAALIVTAAAHPVLLHVTDGVAWPRSGRWIGRQVARTQWLRTPWVSAHLELGSMLLNHRWPRFPLVPWSLAKRWAVNTLQRWIARSPVRVLVENVGRSRRLGHPYLVDPAFIAEVVQQADCFFLLDLAHARVSAAMRGQPIQRYISQLPLYRLVEIHVSGPRRSRGTDRLTDAHEPLQDDDYALLEWVLGVARPMAVSLEYWRDSAQLKEQLIRLRHLLEDVG